MPVRGQTVATKARRMEFLAYLKTLGPGDECVRWPWSTITDGYVFVRYEGKTTTAHRWVYEQINGSLGKLEACHSCDNPPCVRPSHIWAGTHGQNLSDAYQKGRKRNNNKPGSRAGEAHPLARLSWRDVRVIRALYIDGVSQRILGRAFGVSAPQIHNIVAGRSWRE